MFDTPIDRNSHQRCSIIKSLLENFAKFIRKRLRVADVHAIQEEAGDGGGAKSPPPPPSEQFFSCSFYKRRNQPPKLSDF